MEAELSIQYCTYLLMQEVLMVAREGAELDRGLTPRRVQPMTSLDDQSLTSSCESLTKHHICMKSRGVVFGEGDDKKDAAVWAPLFRGVI
jgi:hypothetical protein